MTTQPSKPSTARHGNPDEASRGAAVTRAKQRLGDAIDAQLALDIESMEFALLAKVIGCEPHQVEARLAAATLGEIERWTGAVEGVER